MSLIEEVRDVEQRVLARLRELEPLVAEHRELTALAQHLGLDTAQEPAAPAARAAGRKATKRPRSRPAGETREDQVLGAVRAQPGVTVAEVAKGLGVDATSLYRVVRKLTREGKLTKRGLQLHPA
jgi:hypothetical protein